MAMNHKCIKCKAEYSDNEEDDYLCSDCLVEKNRIAEELNSKYNTVGQKPKGIATLEEEMKIKGGFSQNADGSQSRLFINVKDLGLL